MGIKIEGQGEAALDGIRQQIKNRLKKDDSLKVSMYVADKVKRKEGEKWEEDGKLYEWKNGIKQSISKLQDAKTPYWCPQCKQSMNGRLDYKMYRIHRNPIYLYRNP